MPMTASELKDFEKDIIKKLQKPDFNEQDFASVQQLILATLAMHGGIFYGLCHDVANTNIEFDGWDTIWSDITELAHKGKNCTALGIDISGFGDDTCPEPYLECSYYDNSSFKFSNSNPQEMIASGGPWRGSAFEIKGYYLLKELAALNSAIRNYHTPSLPSGTDAASPDYGTDCQIARWYLIFRLCRAVKSCIDKFGLPMHMPVIISENDFVIVDFNIVYMAAASQKRDEAAAPMLDQRRRKDDDDFIQSMINSRDGFMKMSKIMGMTGTGNPDGLKLLIDMADANCQKIRARWPDIAFKKSICQMDNHEFDALLESIRKARSVE